MQEKVFIVLTDELRIGSEEIRNLFEMWESRRAAQVSVIASGKRHDFGIALCPYRVLMAQYPAYQHRHEALAVVVNRMVRAFEDWRALHLVDDS